MLARVDPRLVSRRKSAWAVLQSGIPDRASQAANSMVEVLDQVIDRVSGSKDFKDYLADRFPKYVEVMTAERAMITVVKNRLHTVKHHAEEQPVEMAEHLMLAAEAVIRLLLR
jgi:hypothetical protein